ncbi:hypothetical protein SEPCBS119000_003265 [Sporothrix epigloea]|uniref:Uncharacterized protein n=1 Tax=Sporothrix epigloea TaxID=1892477 RepID=A0ABP0DMN6_9PEZI
MDDQFGGRTDDDLFADDFEPIQPPATPTVAPDPVSVVAATTKTLTKVPATQPATPSAIEPPRRTAPDATQPSKGRRDGSGTVVPPLGQGATAVNGSTRRNRQPKSNLEHGARQTDAKLASPSPAAPTTCAAPDNSTDLSKSATVLPPSLAQSRHNQPIPAQPAVATQPTPTSTPKSTPLPAPSGGASPAPSQQPSGQRSMRGQGGERKRRGSDHAQAKDIDKDVSAKDSPAPKDSHINSNSKSDTPTEEQQQPSAQKQHQKPQRQPRQRQQQHQQQQQQAREGVSDGANATKAEKGEVTTAVGSEGARPTTPKTPRNARSGNKGVGSGNRGSETAGAAKNGTASGPASSGPNARIQSGANPRTRLTDAELETKMSAMRLAAEEKTRRFEQALRDERDHNIAVAQGREEAQKRKAAEEEKRKRSEEDRRRLEEERSRNRDRKLKAMGVKEGSWDEGKDKEGSHREHDSSSDIMRGLRPAAGILPIANASAVTAKPEPTSTPSRGSRRGGRGERGQRGERGSRAGRTGRGGGGGGRCNKGGIQFNDAGSIGADIADWVHRTTEPMTMAPPSPGPSESGFPSPPASNLKFVTEATAAGGKTAAQGQSYAAKLATNKKPEPAADPMTATNTSPARTKPDLAPLPSMPAVGAWDEEVEEAERNAIA